MDLKLHHGKVALDRLGGLSLRNAAGAAITCLAGRLWITQEGDRRDFVLAPGESFRVRRGGVTLVGAVEPSLLQVTEPRARQAGDRWNRVARAAAQWLDRAFGPSSVRA
jgi:quercetin dioxygenase-like cupin family protein